MSAIAGYQRTIEAAFAAIKVGDVQAMLTHYTHDVVFDIPYASPPKLITGKDNVHTYLSAAFSVFRFELTITAAYEIATPTTAIFEYTGEGHIVATGRPYTNSYVGIYEFRDGFICRVREYFNPVQAQIALGT